MISCRLASQKPRFQGLWLSHLHQQGWLITPYKIQRSTCQVKFLGTVWEDSQCSIPLAPQEKVLHLQPCPNQKWGWASCGTFWEQETVCASIGHSIWSFISANPQISILWAGPKPIAMNALFVPYKEPTLQPGKKSYGLPESRTAVAGNLTCFCICHPCSRAMRTEKFTWVWLLFNHLVVTIAEHGLCLVYVQTHRPARSFFFLVQSFKNLIDANGYASPGCWADLVYAICAYQGSNYSVTWSMFLNQTNVMIQIKFQNKPQTRVTCDSLGYL